MFLCQGVKEAQENFMTFWVWLFRWLTVTVITLHSQQTGLREFGTFVHTGVH